MTIESAGGGPEDGFGAGGRSPVERRMARAGCEVCPKLKVFGVVVDGKKLQNGPKKTGKLKTLSAY